MIKGMTLTGLAVALLLSAEKVQAEDKEPLAVVALGAAGEWGIPGKAFSLGPSASVEFSGRGLTESSAGLWSPATPLQRP
jgi:hypothetical protein